MSAHTTDAEIRAFAKGYVIARERTLVVGDYPPEGHEDHGSGLFVLAMGMGAAYAAASVPFWEAVRLWNRQAAFRDPHRATTPEFVAIKDGDGGRIYTYHEIQDKGLALVVTDEVDPPLYAGACEGRAALEREEGSWVTLSTGQQDAVLEHLVPTGKYVQPPDAGLLESAARALRHLAGRGAS